MRQALIVKNPKWERFTAVSDEFKALSGDAVLVVRGRNKEKQKGKAGEAKIFKKSPESLAKEIADAAKAAVDSIAKKVVKAAAVIALFAVLALPASAQQNILSLLPVTVMGAQTTNTTGQGFIGWNVDDVLVFQAVLQSTNNIHVNTKSNIFLYLDTCLAGDVWATNQYTLSFPTHTYQTNAVASFQRITNTVGGQLLRVGQQANPNTNRVDFVSFYVVKKER